MMWVRARRAEADVYGRRMPIDDGDGDVGVGDGSMVDGSWQV